VAEVLYIVHLNNYPINSYKKDIILISFIGTTGLAFAIILPILIGSIVDTYAFARSMVGWISSINILGAAIGGLITTLRIGRNSLMSIARTGLLILIVFDILSIFCHTEYSILTIRFFSGIGGGIVYAAGLAAFSGLKDSTKAFATYIVVYCFFGGLILISMPFLLGQFGVKAGFIVLALIGIICFTFTPSLDRIAPNIKKREFISLNFLLKNKNVLYGLLSYFLLQMGGGTMWAYCERIGIEAGLTISFIGVVLGISVVFALLGGLVVMKVRPEWGLLKPLLVGIAVMGTGPIFMFFANFKIAFLVGNCIAGVAWSFVIPFYQQMQAKFDQAGRVVSLGTIVNMGGRSAGPAIAAMSLGSSAFNNALWISIIALLLGACLTIPALKGFKSEAN